jgi:hypothetical protein
MQALISAFEAHLRSERLSAGPENREWGIDPPEDLLSAARMVLRLDSRLVCVRVWWSVCLSVCLFVCLQSKQKRS